MADPFEIRAERTLAGLMKEGMGEEGASKVDVREWTTERTVLVFEEEVSLVKKRRGLWTESNKSKVRWSGRSFFTG